MAKRFESGCDLLAMIALNLERAVLDRASRATQTLQIGGDAGQIGGHQPTHHGDDLPAPSALFTKHADDSIARRHRGRRIVNDASPVTVAARIDKATIGHDSSLRLESRLDLVESGLLGVADALAVFAMSARDSRGELEDDRL